MKPNIGAGDMGKCQLFGEGKVDKDFCLVDVYGDLDELNSHMGYLRAFRIVENNFSEITRDIQKDLFVLGSHFSTCGKQPEVATERTDWLEEKLSFLEGQLPELTAFILPSGSQPAAYCHICRSICRRVERRLVGMLKERNQYSPETGASESKDCLAYINRLSDLLFAMARYLNKLEHIEDETWSGTW